MGKADFDVAEFAAQFQRFMRHIDSLAPPPQRSPFHLKGEAHFGTDPADLPAVAEPMAPSDLPNLQLAIEALLEESPEWELVGMPADARHFGGFSLPSILSGRLGSHIMPTAVPYVNVAVGVDQTMACVEMGVYFLHFEGAPVAVLVATGSDHGPRKGLLLEVMSPDRELSGRFLARLKAEMHARNVYRGKVLAFSFGEYGGFGLTFHRVPVLARDDIILPEEDLAAIERHTLVVSAHADALRAAGRPLKRGLLLYGPPGTGKTLSVMYLCNAMAGRTTLLLAGSGAQALGQAVSIARSLQPATVVLEDVDLVAMERTMPGRGTNPLLFQLLNEMDGLAEDADIVFVLTTNRVELLEPALAARPGRIDQAVEIKLPDADARRRLLDRYLRGVDHAVTPGPELDQVVDRTEGVSAAFIKELVRRAVLAGLEQGGPTLTAAALDDAVTELVEHSAPVLRTTLGAMPGAPAGWSPHELG